MTVENVCEHGDHPAPDGSRFCSDECARCEVAPADHEREGCAGICREPRSCPDCRDVVTAQEGRSARISAHNGGAAELERPSRCAECATRAEHVAHVKRLMEGRS